MKKTLGQNGLNFIANKYKELRTALSNKVDKISGKSLSTNDYDNTAKSKVDAIPNNPKYTDTTYDLSKYAEKSDISRCKTKGYNTSSTWQSLSTTRDLEDWIGDFDKRTRELKSGGIEFWSSEIQVYGSEALAPYWFLIKLGNLVILNLQRQNYLSNINKELNIPRNWRPVKELQYPLECSTPQGLIDVTMNFKQNGVFIPRNGSFAGTDGFTIQPFTIIYETAQ